MYSSYQDQPSLTFISKPADMQKDLEANQLYYPFFLLRFRPACECGKDFRSFGKHEKAQIEIAKHVAFKKYADCKPTIEEMQYDVPEFIAINQMHNSPANKMRNAKLKERISQVSFFNKVKFEAEINAERCLEEYGFKLIDGKLFTEKGTEVEIPLTPKVIDGYQISQGINTKLTVKAKAPIRDVMSRSSGQEFKVCETTFVDENNDEIIATLWNEQCEKISVGDSIIIRNAHMQVNEYHNRMELAFYKNATTIEIVPNSVTN